MQIMVSMLFLCLEHPGGRQESHLFLDDPETGTFIINSWKIHPVCKGNLTEHISRVNHTIYMPQTIESLVGWNKTHYMSVVRSSVF